MPRSIGLVLTPLHEQRTLEELVDFYTELGRKPKRGEGKIFIKLDKKQLEALADCRRRLPAQFELGNAGVSLLHEQKKIIWIGFHPFSMAKKLNPPTGIGIGSLLHHAIIEYLATNPEYQHYEVLHGAVGNVEPEREGQLKKMGIEIHTRYPLPEYRRMVSSFIEKKFGRKREIQIEKYE